LTPTVAGVYQVSASVGVTAVDTSKCGIAIVKNGSVTNNESQISFTIAGGSASETLQASALIYCNGTTDTISVQGWTQGSTFLSAATAGTAINFIATLLQSGPAGAAGSTGATGPAGPGVPVGGATSQVLAKNSATDYDTHWVPPSGISDAPSDGTYYGRQNASWQNVAPLNSPALTGTPTAPTPTAGDNSTKLATTAFAAALAATTSGNRVLISRQVVSSPVASVNFLSGIGATYDDYELVMMGAKPAATATLFLRFSTDGTTWISSASYGNFVVYVNSSAPAAVTGNYSAATGIQAPGNVGSTYGDYLRLRFNRSIASILAVWDLVHYTNDNTNQFYGSGSGAIYSASPPVGIQAIFNAQNCVAGTFSLYGIVK
jgi:hypothetical protein